MMKSSAERRLWVSSHPVKASVLFGLGWGLAVWLSLGVRSHAFLNPFAFAYIVGAGLLFFGPTLVVFIRRQQSIVSALTRLPSSSREGPSEDECTPRPPLALSRGGTPADMRRFGVGSQTPRLRSDVSGSGRGNQQLPSLAFRRRGGDSSGSAFLWRLAGCCGLVTSANPSHPARIPLPALCGASCRSSLGATSIDVGGTGRRFPSPCFCLDGPRPAGHATREVT